MGYKLLVFKQIFNGGGILRNINTEYIQSTGCGLQSVSLHSTKYIRPGIVNILDVIIVVIYREKMQNVHIIRSNVREVIQV